MAQRLFLCRAKAGEGGAGARAITKGLSANKPQPHKAHMDQIYDNRYYSAASREPSPRRARTVQLGGSDYAGADRSTQRPTSTSRPNAQVNTSTDGPVRPTRSPHSSRPSAQTHDKSSRPSSRLSGSDFMRYANDNAVVKAIYDFTHGSLRPLFIGIVVALALVSLYFPVRRPVRGKTLERHLGQAGRDSPAIQRRDEKRH